MHHSNGADTLDTETLASPFAENVVFRHAESPEPAYEFRDDEAANPFAATGSTLPAGSSPADPRAQARLTLSAALHDQEFNEVLYNVASELNARGDGRPAGAQFEFGGTTATLAQQTYVNQLLEASHAMIDQVREQL